MAKKPVCLVCQKEMEVGFITDLGDADLSANIPRWCPGTPKPATWTGSEVKSEQFARGLKVVAYRCPECEALRLYAPSTPPMP